MSALFLDGRTQRALLLLQHHRPAEAETELRGHLSEHPTDVDALLLLSLALTQQDKHTDAVSVAQEAVAAAPDRASAHHYLAKALFHKGDLAKARLAAEESIRLDPEEADHFGVLALVLNHQGEHAAALKAAEQGLALEPEHLTCLNVRSIELSLAKRFQEADSAMNKALELDPENPYTHSNTGWAVLRRGRSGADERCVERISGPCSGMSVRVSSGVAPERRSRSESVRRARSTARAHSASSDLGVRASTCVCTGVSVGGHPRRR